MFIISCDEPGCDAKVSAYDVADEGWQELGEDSYCPRHHRAHSLSDDRRNDDVVGFNAPEDGSEARYQARVEKRPWLHHTSWWVIHNVIAHPLIGFFPLRPLFRFHDWTSRKMHGKA